MNTRIPDKSPCAASTASHTEAFSKAGYSLPRQVTPRKSSDGKCSDCDTRSAGTNAKKATVSAEDALHFEVSMRSDEQRSKDCDADSSSEQDFDSHEKEPHEEDVSGELAFASLFAGRFDVRAGAESAKAETAKPAASSQRTELLAEHLAERILVSEISAAGQEVRIQPAGDILPYTEICLVRGTDGLLSAVIHADNPAAFQTLAAAQHDLRTRLEASEGQPVRVELRSSADDYNDPRRRSRGLDLDPHA